MARRRARTYVPANQKRSRAAGKELAPLRALRSLRSPLESVALRTLRALRALRSTGLDV